MSGILAFLGWAAIAIIGGFTVGVVGAAAFAVAVTTIIDKYSENDDK